MNNWFKGNLKISYMGFVGFFFGFFGAFVKWAFKGFKGKFKEAKDGPKTDDFANDLFYEFSNNVIGIIFVVLVCFMINLVGC